MNEPCPYDLRRVPCPYCDGEGGWDVFTGRDPRDGSDTGYFEHCEHCDGTGGILDECPLIHADDIDDWIGAAP